MNLFSSGVVTLAVLAADPPSYYEDPEVSSTDAKA